MTDPHVKDQITQQFLSNLDTAARQFLTGIAKEFGLEIDARLIEGLATEFAVAAGSHMDSIIADTKVAADRAMEHYKRYAGLDDTPVGPA